MAFAGYLIKLKGGTAEELPMKYMAFSSYKANPDQRMEASDTSRATTGYLHRTTVQHTATKIEFETPAQMTNKDIATLNALIAGHYTDVLQRKLVIEYYDNETDSYKEGTVYCPDREYPIERIDKNKNLIYYNPIRYAFIEY